MLGLVQVDPTQVRGELAAGVTALLRAAYPDDSYTAEEYYRAYGRPAIVMALRDAAEVIAHAAVYERRVRIGDESVDIGMLGGVAVAPAHRRRGHCKRLIGHANDYLRARGATFAILFAYEPSVYLSSGYRPMLNETRFLDSDGEWKRFVYRGGMYIALQDKPWPNELVDLCGRAV
jgi:predicted acetyltransferase